MKYSLFLLMILTQAAFAQPDKQRLTLQESYKLMHQNFPSASKLQLQEKITELNTKIARSGRYPDVQFSGNVSYQSDVTEIPFETPGATSPSFSHDHYSVSVDISQPVFDGGRVRSAIETQQHSGEAEKARVETELRELRSQVNQVYFGILKLQKQSESHELLLQDIIEQREVVRARVRNGILLPGEEWVLQAEFIKAEQQLIQIRSDIRAGYQALSELLGIIVTEETDLEIPSAAGWNQTYEILRPEYDMFDASQLSLDSQKELTKADKLPSLSFFARSGYGRPGLNAFDDDLQFYWIVGLRARWSFKNAHNAVQKTEVLSLQQRSIEADRDAFTRRLNINLRQNEEQINALEDQLEQDMEILNLRTRIVAERQKQLEEGAITSTEYVTELNEENRARVNLELRKIQIAQSVSEYLTQKGILWNGEN